MTTLPRDQLLAQLQKDLIGPQDDPGEVIHALPSDQYIAGILYPQNVDYNAEDDEDKDNAEDADGSPGQSISMASMRRPNMMGISFALQGDDPTVHLTAHLARYVRCWKNAAGKILLVEEKGALPCWKREPLTLECTLPATPRLTSSPAATGLTWWVRAVRMNREAGEAHQVTVVLTNDQKPLPGREEAERCSFFQASFEARAGEGCALVPRRPRQAKTDEESLTNAIIYRNAAEWAVGHTCSATWDTDESGKRYVAATWLPRQRVPSMSADGHPLFREESLQRAGTSSGSFNAEQLSSLGTQELVRSLEALPAAYSRWLDEQEKKLQPVSGSVTLPPDLLAQAHRHIQTGRNVVKRMRAGIALLQKDDLVREAFQLSQAAMVLQRRWFSPQKPEMMWRPFQLGFQLLTLAGLAAPTQEDGSLLPDRETMDLLWFPTGGGKTEAYLGITAFTLFYRRFRHGASPDAGSGVAVIMRYTLRLLTVQQFERAARLVMACDYLRRTRVGLEKRLGQTPFSIGMWVGSAATPNKLEDTADPAKARASQQLARCPACGEKKNFQWTVDPKKGSSVRCTSGKCELGRLKTSLGIWTIDEEVYAQRPSLVIGTVDKFAQIVRQPSSHQLLGGDAPQPPELIIQDELHLISGPLGTVTGLYEAAIDLICTHKGVPPKVIGSTATIRRADDQVKQLFNRSVMQFPPPILDADDSCFAVTDLEVPGRLYVGVTTAGRSPKFILQAVCASLMQGASEPILSDKERDPYWTLVAYFNSLRELGGALVMMQDDVNDSMKTYAGLHGHPMRQLEEQPLELTSRVEQADIPRYLVQLEEEYPGQEVAAVLATNMISVGVDVPRLGLMVVNGQPKGMAEYIQATSRVGRGNVAGLVVTVYNAGRPRDRSHYEAFRTWHQTLYREVEATSVTPFAPRARDRALHAAIVALARHRIPGMLQDAELTTARKADLEKLVDELVRRAKQIDHREGDGVRQDASRFLDEWHGRGQLDSYWNELKPMSSLLVSMETVATAKAIRGEWGFAARGTPNSMRDVEAETLFRMAEGLKKTEEGA